MCDNPEQGGSARYWNTSTRDERTGRETNEKIVARRQIEYFEPILRHYSSLGSLGFVYSENDYQPYGAIKN